MTPEQRTSVPNPAHVWTLLVSVGHLPPRQEGMMRKYWFSALSLLAVAGRLHGETSIPHTIYQSRLVDGVVVCTQTAAEALALAESTTRTLNPHVNATGLTILLQGTAQMDAFPAAKAAFLRAASTWESYLTNPITIVINVDYGPTRFGQPYDPLVLGATDSASTPILYSLELLFLRASATRQYEADLYAQLPVVAVSTDLGTTSLVIAPRSELRAIGFLPASPSAAEPRPSIGFNSAYAFDLDRSDGITAEQYDFESTAFHEIGHVLGFSSTVGVTELSPALPAVVSPLDLFRVRPGASLAAFASTQRIQSSGGQQVLFTNLGELDLSTGRSDGSGGDGNQASHWKDDELLGFYLGAMHPRLRSETVAYATLEDLIAFDIMGYNVIYPISPAAPTDLIARATSATQVQLTWQDNSSNESEFRLEWYVNGAWIEYGGIPANNTSKTVDNLTPNTAYHFILLATNAGGVSDYTNQAAATTYGSCVPPSITAHPASQVVSAGGFTILSVTATGTSPLSYQWYHGASGSGVAVGGAIAATFNTGPLFVTESYWVKVSNACGSVNSTAAVLTVLQPSSPSAPKSLAFRDRTATGVVLTWTHDGNNVTGFRGYFSLNGTNFTAMNDMPAEWRGTQVSNMKSNAEYRFYLVAVNAAGESSLSNVVVVPAYQPPRRRAISH